MNSYVKGDKGFALFEVVVSIAMVVIVIVALSSLFIQSASTISYTGNRSEAVNSLKRDIEVEIAEIEKFEELDDIEIIGAEFSMPYGNGIIESNNIHNPLNNSYDEKIGFYLLKPGQ